MWVGAKFDGFWKEPAPRFWQGSSPTRCYRNRVLVVLISRVCGAQSPSRYGHQDTTTVTITSITVTITSITFIITSPFHVVDEHLEPLLFVHAPRCRTARVWQRYVFPCHIILFSQVQVNVRYRSHLGPGSITCKSMYVDVGHPTSSRVNNAATTPAVIPCCKTYFLHDVKVYQTSVVSRYRSPASHFHVPGWNSGVRGVLHNTR